MRLSPLGASLRRASTAIASVLVERGMPDPMAQVNATLVAFGLLVGDDTTVREVEPESLVPEGGGRSCSEFARLLLSGMGQQRTQMALAVAEAVAMAEPSEADHLLGLFVELSNLSGDDVAVLVALAPEAAEDPAWQRRCACIDEDTRRRSTQALERLGLVRNETLTAAGMALQVLASWHPEIL